MGKFRESPAALAMALVSSSPTALLRRFFLITLRALAPPYLQTPTPLNTSQKLICAHAAMGVVGMDDPKLNSDPEQKFIDQIQQFKEAQWDETGKVRSWLVLADKISNEP